jgi:hypothetical protein
MVSPLKLKFSPARTLGSNSLAIWMSVEAADRLIWTYVVQSSGNNLILRKNDSTQAAGPKIEEYLS